VEERKNRKEGPISSPANPKACTQKGKAGDHPNRFASTGIIIIHAVNPIMIPSMAYRTRRG